MSAQPALDQHAWLLRQFFWGFVFAYQGKEQDAVERVRTAYLATLTRAATGRILTHRARSQLKQACLAAATYKVLLEVAPVRCLIASCCCLSFA
jgi:hypothetical protein